MVTGDRSSKIFCETAFNATCHLLLRHQSTCHTSRYMKQAPGNDRDYYHRKLLMVLGEAQVLEMRIIIILVISQLNAQNLV